MDPHPDIKVCRLKLYFSYAFGVRHQVYPSKVCARIVCEERKKLVMVVHFLLFILIATALGSH
jgi:hypothetical protein